MALEQGAGTAVTLGVGEFGEEVAADADRIAALSLVAGYDEVIAGEGCGDGEPGGRRDVRHVGEANHYARASRRNHAQAGLQAEAHALVCCFGVDYLPVVAELGGKCCIVGPEDYDTGAEVRGNAGQRGKQQRAAVGQQGLALVTAEPACLAGCQHDAGGGPGAVHAVPWRWPARRRVSSPRTAMAISGGVLLPMSRPTGACRRAICSSGISRLRRRSRREALVREEPIAPT